MNPVSLFESFEAQAVSAPARPALLESAAAPELSRRALLERSHALARSMHGEGLGRGEIVLVAPGDGPAFVMATLAVWACDAVALLADPHLTPSEFEALRSTFLPRLALLPAANGLPRVQGFAAAAPCEGPPAGTAAIKLTSGSTGRPRGIAVSAAQLRADVRQIVLGMGIGPDDANVAVLPMSHSYGLSNLLLPLVVQGTPLVIVPPLAPDLLAAALSIERPAVFAGVPYLFDLLARPGGPRLRPRGLKLCISAGALLRSRVAAAFRDRYGLPVRCFYGASETGGLTFDASPDGAAALATEGCVGTALPGVEIFLDGEEARVAARSAGIAYGYLGRGEETGNGEFRDGAFYTGDTGRIDAEGRLHLTGRFGSSVNVSGRKVNPREIELALEQIDGVHDAAVISLPDEVRGESLVACLVADPGLARERVLSHLREHLASWKLPRQVVFLEALPRSARGKLDVQALKEKVASA